MRTLCLFLLLTGAPALVAQQTSPQVSPPAMSEDYNPFVWQGEDANFALAMLQTDYCAVELSKLAASKTADSDVRELAHSAREEQSKFYHKLRSVAKAYSIWLPPESQLHKCADLDRARTLSGSELDKAYLTSMERTTADSLSRMQAEIARPEKTNTSALRRLAADHLSAVERLQTQAQALSKSNLK